MTTTYTIAQMERQADNDFVTIVHWRASKVDGDYSASSYGTVSYTQESESFVPFADLTEATVIGWVQESLDTESLEAGLASQIEAQRNPVSVAGMPW